ncbi:hypothetical protein QOT17_023958 [Balamuthia mandrillaris]
MKRAKRNKKQEEDVPGPENGKAKEPPLSTKKPRMTVIKEDTDLRLQVFSTSIQEDISSSVTARCWIEEMLPDDIIYHIMVLLPPGSAAVAARSCRRWYACAPKHLQNKLSSRQMFHQVETLQWAAEEGMPLYVKLAANEGSLEVLHWLVEEKHITLTWTWLASAATASRLEVMQWMFVHGCPLDPRVCHHAARNGQLEALKWFQMQQQGLSVKASAWRIIDTAAKYGQLQVLQWLSNHGT